MFFTSSSGKCVLRRSVCDIQEVSTPVKKRLLVAGRPTEGTAFSKLHLFFFSIANPRLASPQRRRRSPLRLPQKGFFFVPRARARVVLLGSTDHTRRFTSFRLFTPGVGQTATACSWQNLWSAMWLLRFENIPPVSFVTRLLNGIALLASRPAPRYKT